MPRRRAVLEHFQAFLPSIFQILSMVFILVATNSAKWSYNDSYEAGDQVGSYIIVRLHRSPVFNCVANIDPNTLLPVENCSNPILCDPTNSFDNDQICFLLAFSKHTLIASNVLIGLACVFGLILCLAAILGNRRLPPASPKRRPPVTTAFLAYGALLTFLCSLTGTLTLIVTQGVATVTLLFAQQPEGNFITTDGATNDESPWMPGEYQKYLFMSWGFGVLGMFAMLRVWLLPDWSWERRLRRGEAQEDDVGTRTGQGSRKEDEMAPGPEVERRLD